MRFIDKFVRTVKGALPKKMVDRPEFLRQNTPPDEREAEIAEQCEAAETKSGREPVAVGRRAAGR
jgi:hypothetical protein